MVNHHQRNFGISGVTTRRASGAQPPCGPHIAPSTRRDNIISLTDVPNFRQSNSAGRLDAASRPFIPETDKDFFALCFALFVLAGPVMLLGFGVFGWFLFVD